MVGHTAIDGVVWRGEAPPAPKRIKLNTLTKEETLLWHTSGGAARGRRGGLVGGPGAPDGRYLMQLGVDQRLPARIVAVRAPQEVMDQRRRRLREEAQRRGRMVSAAQLALAAWTIVITTVPAERLSIHVVLVVARARWHIELVFKCWKSQGHIDESRSGKPWRVICDVDAKLLAMQVHHWIRLIGLWDYPDRSLAKAVQTVQKYAMALGRDHTATSTWPCMAQETIAAPVKKPGPPIAKVWDELTRSPCRRRRALPEPASPRGYR
ncbi:MAG: hypothetical protein KatS3mg057_1444 [Herpetosiphonaceae bacterium]|nr:MAG: hypothetical protein KatS3mg057_1444 [Herpetosiphonaceae bacterium]